MAEGPDSTIYIMDFHNCRVVQLNNDGNYSRSIGGPGSGPGEFIAPFGRLVRSGDFIYIPDDYGLRLQIFDLHINYKRSILNTALDCGFFSIGRDGVILSAPTSLHQLKQSYMIRVQDSLGHDIINHGIIDSKDPIVYNKIISNVPHFRSPYFTIATQKAKYIWCVFCHLPVIRKYDYEGILVEEIRFESKEIESAIEQTKKDLKNQKGSNITGGGVLIHEYPYLLENGDLVVNISLFGNLQLSGNDPESKIVRKYEYYDPSGSDPRIGAEIRTDYRFTIINKKYCGFVPEGIIVQEI